MAITIGGIKIRDITLTHQKEEGTTKVTGNYELISSTGKVLAKQGFNSYNEISLEMSGDSHKLLADFQASVARDLNKTLGLE